MVELGSKASSTKLVVIGLVRRKLIVRVSHNRGFVSHPSEIGLVIGNEELVEGNLFGIIEGDHVHIVINQVEVALAHVQVTLRLAARAA